MASQTTLPQKENALFKRILKCYEQKQYKNGLKFAKQILSNPKFSEHGETLAMKGLTLSCMGKKEEAYEYVKRGLKNHLKSHVCWHAYGLLQRADRKYDEAIKCYRNALKWDKDNIQILRDLSLLQIQMRDLEGYRDTRYQLLALRPGQKVSWVGYAACHHLLNDYDMAFKVLEEFRKTQTPKDHDYEHSELILYQNSILVEAGKFEEALQHINQYSSQTVDKLCVQETKASLFLKLGNKTEAEKIFIDLLSRNPENIAYYKGLEEARDLDCDEMKEEMYRGAIGRFPRALTPKLLLLRVLKDSSFRSEVDIFLTTCIRKGVPPLFKNLRRLYDDRSKIKAVEELVLSYIENLQDTGYFHKEDMDGKECPTSLLWSYFYLSQHYDYLKNYKKALLYIDLAIQHTMTLIELYLVKAKIYKHSGDIQNAVACLDEAQSLDTADRYINCKCTKYMLRAGMMEEAQAMAAKFTREGVCPTENLNEMQCMWHGIECALHYKNTHQFGMALKKCHEIDRHFSEIIEDQFDFHTYCMRKMTLRSYMQLLRLEDKLREHKFFFKAACIAIEIYLYLHKTPHSEKNSTHVEETDNLSASERKKLKNKQRKKELQLQQQQTKKQQQQQNKNKNQDADVDHHKEEELIPEKLAKPENALDEAAKFLKPLQLFSPQNIITQILSFKVAFEKGKILQMMKAVKRGIMIDPLHPQMHECAVKFLIYVSQNIKNSQSPVVSQVVERCISTLFSNMSAKQYNEKYLETISSSSFNRQNSLEAFTVALKMKAVLEEKKKKESLDELLKHLSIKEGHEIEAPETNNPSVQDYEEVLKTLREGHFGNCEKAMNLVEVQFKEAFKLESIFKNKVNNMNEDSNGEESSFSNNINSTSTSEKNGNEVQKNIKVNLINGAVNKL